MERFVVDWLAKPGLLEALEALRKVVLDGCEGGNDGWGAKPVGGVGEVGEVTLDLWLEDHGGLGVAQGGPVLVQQVHQLLRHNPGRRKIMKGISKKSHLVARRSSFLLNCSALLPDLPVRYSATWKCCMKLSVWIAAIMHQVLKVFKYIA